METERLFSDEGAIAPEVAQAVGNLDRTSLVDFMASLLGTWWENANGCKPSKAQRDKFVTIAHETLAHATRV